MKALIFVKNAPSRPMGQLMDRPFLQHTVEQLVRRGVDRIEMALPENASTVRELLGDGSRWGIAISCRTVPGPMGYPALARFCEAGSMDPVWIGPAENLAFLPEGGEPAWPALYFECEGVSSRWSGWASMREGQVEAFVAALTGQAGWREAARASDVSFQKIFLDLPSLSAASAKDLLLANRTVLEGRWPGLHFWGKERRPGIWIARGARIHASAELESPCYIGEDAWIGAHSRIGAGTVVAPGAVVERETSVVRSVVGRETYLGPGLELRDCVVEANRVYNTRLDAELAIREPHIVSGLRSSWLGLWKRTSAVGAEAAS